MRSENLEIGRAPAAPALPDAAAVRAQLTRVLGSSHFRNSKRSQALLRFVVEAALDRHPDILKERSIGVSVFGRDATYDTAQDAIVRNAAVEVRKRLAQYYLEPEHSGELRIELPAGSYMPMFPAEPLPVAELITPAPRRSRRLWLAGALALLALGAAVLFWLERRTPAGELDAFWEPLFRNREVIQICVGQPGKLYRFVGPRHDELDQLIQSRSGAAATAAKKGNEPAISPSEVAWIASDYLYMRDAFSAAKIASWIQSKGHRAELLSVTRTTYSQLRRTPLVAIGGFDNPWALRVTAELRYVFDHKTINGTEYNCVTDRRNPGANTWMVAKSLGTGTTQDYAIVTRVFDPATERTVVSVAGIENYGTLAAGEFVTDAEYLGAVLAQSSKDWRRKNLQIVLGTKVIEGTPGPPTVLASCFW